MVKANDWTREELEKDIIGKYDAVTIPVNIHIKGAQRILNFAEVRKTLEKARVIALGECYCRKRVKSCNAPIDVCISLDKEAENEIANNRAKKIDIEQALATLKRSHEAGLVHVTYTIKGNRKTDIICSCCSCCCHTLSALTRFGMQEAVTPSSYITTTNPDTCINCGKCAERCQFKARYIEHSKLIYNKDKCFGCGVCLTTCPTKSIMLQKRDGKRNKK